MATDMIDRAVAEAAQPHPTITIALKPNGNMDISSPIHNKRLCYNMLLEAIVQIAQHQEEQRPDVIVPAFVPPGNIRPA